MRLKELKKEVAVPEGVNVDLDGSKLTAKGPKGENSRTLIYPKIKLAKAEDKITLTAKDATKKDKTMMGTFTAHIANLLTGVKDGFGYKLKVCSGHFPMTVAMDNNQVVINNFMGEKVPRKANILQDVEVKIENDMIIVSGFDKENVGQSAANIELATKRSGFDKRIFQDGCYIVEKSGKGVK
jgi:large subunit ribosomal protein L6